MYSCSNYNISCNYQQGLCILAKTRHGVREKPHGNSLIFEGLHAKSHVTASGCVYDFADAIFSSFSSLCQSYAWFVVVDQHRGLVLSILVPYFYCLSFPYLLYLYKYSHLPLGSYTCYWIDSLMRWEDILLFGVEALIQQFPPLNNKPVREAITAACDKNVVKPTQG